MKTSPESDSGYFLRRGTISSIVHGTASLFLSTSIASAQGGPPLRTDDPGTPGDGHFECNLAITMERADDRRTFEAPLLDFNYGWGDHVQLKFEVPWVHVDEREGTDRNGLGNSTVGVKWRFRDAREREPALSMYPQVEFENPGSSSGARGLVEEGTSLILPFEAAWNLGAIGVGLEVGRVVSSQGPDTWITGLACSRRLSERLEFVAEIYGEAEASFESSSGTVGVGSRLQLAPGRVLLASVGSGLWSDNSERLDATAYLGIQFQF